MGYSKQAIAGFSWHSILKFLTALLALVKVAILARLLSPTDFGLFSLVVIALGLTEATTQTGINITILQSKHSIRYFLNTAWVIAILRGLVIGILMVLLGLLMTTYYQEPQLLFLVGLAALVPLIKGFINPALVSFHKDLQFFQDSLFRFVVIFLETLSAVLLGLWLHSVLALVLALLVGAVLEVLLSFVIFRDRPVFQFIPSRAKEIFSNAKGLSLSALLTYLSENIDDFILGKVVGTYNLGLYHAGYGLAHKPNYDVAKAAHHGTLPIYTKISQDAKRLKRAFWRTSVATMLIATLLSLPLIFLPELVVSLILGSEWLQVARVLPLLAIAGILQSLTTVLYTVFLAKKQYRFINTHLLLTVLLLVPGLFLLSNHYGLWGGVLAVVLSRALTLPLLLFGIFRTLKS